MHLLTISQTGGDVAKEDETEERKVHDKQCCLVVTNDQLINRACLYTPRKDKVNKN
jgi:hypothetical protein